ASSSIRKAWRPVCWAAIRVEPEPANRSSTCSPGRDEYCRARTANYRLLGQVHHALGVDLLDAPDVGGVVGAEELVGGPFAPAVEAPLVVAHEVLAGQHRVLLHPDHRLGVIQPQGLQDRRVVADVGVTAPE